MYVSIFLALKEVSMKVPQGNWTNCGGTINEKIKVKIFDLEFGTNCVTRALEYKVGQEIIVWNTDNLLSNCTEMKIDSVKSRLQGTVIEGKDEIKSCIKFVNVVLNDTNGTVYEKDPSALTKKVHWVKTCIMSKS